MKLLKSRQLASWSVGGISVGVGVSVSVNREAIPYHVGLAYSHRSAFRREKRRQAYPVSVSEWVTAGVGYAKRIFAGMDAAAMNGPSEYLC